MNDSSLAWKTRPWLILAVLNAIGALTSGVFGVIALIDPTARTGIEGPLTADITLYAMLYGIRSVALTIAVLVLLFIDRRRGGERLAPLLWVAGAIQAADTIVIAVVAGDPAMAIGPAIGAITHLVSAGLIVRHRRRSLASAAA